MKSLFCSKTVALCYKHVGLIPQHRGASDVLPKHFSTKYDYFLALQVRHVDARACSQVPVRARAHAMASMGKGVNDAHCSSVIALLSAQDGASLGPELPLSFEPAAVHDFTVYLLSIADPRNGCAHAYAREHLGYASWHIVA